MRKDISELGIGWFEWFKIGLYSFLHSYKKYDDGMEIIIPFGKSKIAQFLHLINPLNYARKVYRIRSYVAVTLYNFNWINNNTFKHMYLRLKKKFKKNRYTVI